MDYLKFDKTQLVNLEYSLPKEIILANQNGAYCSTSIVGCNTRKYHGLLIAPVEKIDGGRLFERFGRGLWCKRSSTLLHVSESRGG